MEGVWKYWIFFTTILLFYQYPPNTLTSGHKERKQNKTKHNEYTIQIRKLRNNNKQKTVTQTTINITIQTDHFKNEVEKEIKNKRKFQ